MTLPRQARFLQLHRGENADLRILAKYIPSAASIVNATDTIIRLFVLKSASTIAAPAATIIECPEGYERSRSAGKENCIFREISGLVLATRSLLMMDNGIRTSTAITMINAVFLPSHPPKIAINKMTTGHINSLPYCVSRTMGLSSHT